MPPCSPTAACCGRRWDNAPGKDAMHLYSSNPDGTDLQLYYGANSHNTGTNNTVVEFVHPRADAGRAHPRASRASTPTWTTAATLMIIDGAQYVENTQALLGSAGRTGPAQSPATTHRRRRRSPVPPRAGASPPPIRCRTAPAASS